MRPMLRRLAVAAVGTTVLTGALATGATAASAAPATLTAPVTRDSEDLSISIDFDFGDLLCAVFGAPCDDDADTGDDGGVILPDVPGTGDDGLGDDTGDDMTGPVATVGPEIPAGDGVNR